MSDLPQAGELPPGVATQDRPAVSPSGEYQLAVVADEQEGFTTQRFQILDSQGALLYDCPDHYLERALTFFLWGLEDRAWVYSGDLGTFFYEMQGDPGEWSKSTYAKSEVPAPPFLKEVRPRWHQR